MTNFNVKCPYFVKLSKVKYRGGEGKGGEGFFRRSRRRRHLPKIRTFKEFGHICFWTDRQTDIVVLREVTLPKICGFP